MVLNKVKPGDNVLASQHNDLVDAIDTKVDASFVKGEVSKLVGSAPETLDTLEELATALTENKDTVSALNAAIGSKADKTKTETAITALENAMKTSDKHKSVTWNAAKGSIDITHKDGTVVSTVIPKQQAVYG